MRDGADHGAREDKANERRVAESEEVVVIFEQIRHVSQFQFQQ